MIVNNTWTKIEYTKGTIQNVSVYPIYITDDTSEKGLKILQNQTYEFTDLQLYVKCKREVEIIVKPFNTKYIVSGGSGSQSQDGKNFIEMFKIDGKYKDTILIEDLPTATETTIKYNVGNYSNVDKTDLTEINLPNLQETGNNFLYFYFAKSAMNKIYFPKLKTCGDKFLKMWACANDNLKYVDLPELETCGTDFLGVVNGANHHSLKYVNIPKLKKSGNGFFYVYNSPKMEFNTVITTGSVNPYNTNVTINTVIISEYSTAISAKNMFVNATNVIINCQTPPPLTANLFDNVSNIYIPKGTLSLYENATNYDLYNFIEFDNYAIDKDTGLCEVV